MGVKKISSQYGAEVLTAIVQNDLNRLKTFFDKRLRSDEKIRELCEMEVLHKPTKTYACPFMLAVRLRDPAIVRYMLECGVDANFVHRRTTAAGRSEFMTPLHVAVDLGHYDVVDALLSFNADCNIRDHNNNTPLHIAVSRADTVMTRTLLMKSADVNAIDNGGNSCLHTASRLGHFQLVATLISFRADVNRRSVKDGALPIQIAAYEGHADCVKLYKTPDCGPVDASFRCFNDARQVAALHLAATGGHHETVKVLIDSLGASVDNVDSHGNTALLCTVLKPYNARRMRDRESYRLTAQALIERRADVNWRNLYGDTALHLAAMNRYPRIVQLLLESAANCLVANLERLKPIDLVPRDDHITRQLLNNYMYSVKRQRSSKTAAAAERTRAAVAAAAAVATGQNKRAPATAAANLPQTSLVQPADAVRRQRPADGDVQAAVLSTVVTKPTQVVQTAAEVHQPDPPGAAAPVYAQPMSTRSRSVEDLTMPTNRRAVQAMSTATRLEAEKQVNSRAQAAAAAAAEVDDVTVTQSQQPTNQRSQRRQRIKSNRSDGGALSTGCHGDYTRNYDQIDDITAPSRQVQKPSVQQEVQKRLDPQARSLSSTQLSTRKKQRHDDRYFDSAVFDNNDDGFTSVSEVTASSSSYVSAPAGYRANPAAAVRYRGRYDDQYYNDNARTTQYFMDNMSIYADEVLANSISSHRGRSRDQTPDVSDEDSEKNSKMARVEQRAATVAELHQQLSPSLPLMAAPLPLSSDPRRLPITAFSGHIDAYGAQPFSPSRKGNTIGIHCGNHNITISLNTPAALAPVPTSTAAALENTAAGATRKTAKAEKSVTSSSSSLSQQRGEERRSKRRTRRNKPGATDVETSSEYQTEQSEVEVIKTKTKAVASGRNKNSLTLAWAMQQQQQQQQQQQVEEEEDDDDGQWREEEELKPNSRGVIENQLSKFTAD